MLGWCVLLKGQARLPRIHASASWQAQALSSQVLFYKHVQVVTEQTLACLHTRFWGVPLGGHSDCYPCFA